MKANCATNLPCLPARGVGHLPELLEEGDSPSLAEVFVYTYDGFGNLLPPTEGPAPAPFWDLEQLPGDGMQAARARCYDPTPGRWLDHDPVGFAGGDANLYRYVNTEGRGILINEDGTIRDA